MWSRRVWTRSARSYVRCNDRAAAGTRGARGPAKLRSKKPRADARGFLSGGQAQPSERTEQPVVDADPDGIDTELCTAEDYSIVRVEWSNVLAAEVIMHVFREDRPFRREGERHLDPPADGPPVRAALGEYVLIRLDPEPISLVSPSPTALDVEQDHRIPAVPAQPAGDACETV